MLRRHTAAPATGVPLAALLSDALWHRCCFPQLGRMRAMTTVESRRSRLRQIAEEQVKNSARSVQAIPKEELPQLIHELEVHQVELEMQNEELRQSESRLEELRQKYFDLYDLAPVGYVTLDRKGRIWEINLTGAKLLGWERDRLKGSYFGRFVERSGQDEIYKFCQRLFENGGREEIEVTIRHGEKAPLDLLLSGVAAQYPEGNGNACQVAMTDITARKAAESWRRKLIETTEDAVIAIDRKSQIALFNPAAENIFKYSAEEVIGKKINILMPEPYRSEHDRYIDRYERTGVTRAIGKIREAAGLRKNGEVFPIEISLTKIGHEVRYVAFIRDVSERAELQAQIVERARLATIDNTTAVMAHEIANPLAFIAISIELLERHLGETSDAIVNDTLRRTSGEISRLKRLLNDYRSTSTPEPYSFRPVSPTLIIEELCVLEKPKLAAEGISVETAIEPELPAVCADPDKIRQVLLNLFNNAAEAMPGGGALTVRGYKSAGKVVIEVRDTGVGVSSDWNLFQPFQTTKISGTGLGLIIARQIVSRHQGTLSYTSEPAKGTTFSVSLPIYSPSQAPESNVQD
ncbi:MAG: PAS domain S-box protein [Alphaproteobacteria bacterium]